MVMVRGLGGFRFARHCPYRFHSDCKTFIVVGSKSVELITIFKTFQ